MLRRVVPTNFPGSGGFFWWVFTSRIVVASVCVIVRLLDGPVAFLICELWVLLDGGDTETDTSPYTLRYVRTV